MLQCSAWELLLRRLHVHLQVSVSEFMSLVKALTGRRSYSASARAPVGGFDKKQAYRLLRCVDKDGDRRVVLRDLVVFVFATWTEELNRLARECEDEEVRQKRRQLQKVLLRIVLVVMFHDASKYLLSIESIPATCFENPKGYHGH